MRAALAATLAMLAAGGVQKPFTVQTELVRIDVLVERNGAPVAGLSAADFAVEDNGVSQRVRLLSDTAAVTVSTVLDVSGSMTAEQLANAGAGVRAVVAALDERDRHALYAFAGNVRHVALPQGRDTVSADSIARAIRASGGTHTSLCDALC
jgi:Mg-chelatase subunit ChlD